VPELRRILDLAKRAMAAQDEVCVATVVGIEGSAYRRPGARMILTRSGERAGTVSGGCLEGEIVRKAWWLTENGAAIQRYSSFFDDDGDMPYGLGCGGTVIVLLERGEPAVRTLHALRSTIEERRPWVVVTDTSAETPGTVLLLNDAGEIAWRRASVGNAAEIAADALNARSSRSVANFFFEYLAPPPSVFVFGAGDDAKPLVEFMAELDWHVTVADGRAQMIRPDRFPQAASVIGLDAALGAAAQADAAVVMTHSYDQDRQILRALLPLHLKYVGILGPRRRTERLAGEIAPALGLTADDCMARLHSPVGLDLGGHTPAAVALSVTAEVQAVLSGRGAKKPSPVHA
jgi:xanthine/CO dehydrogenase XdhC/CoxF family maturation factor